MASTVVGQVVGRRGGSCAAPTARPPPAGSPPGRGPWRRGRPRAGCRRWRRSRRSRRPPRSPGRARPAIDTSGETKVSGGSRPHCSSAATLSPARRRVRSTASPYSDRVRTSSASSAATSMVSLAQVRRRPRRRRAAGQREHAEALGAVEDRASTGSSRRPAVLACWRMSLNTRPGTVPSMATASLWSSAGGAAGQRDEPDLLVVDEVEPGLRGPEHRGRAVPTMRGQVARAGQVRGAQQGAEGLQGTLVGGSHTSSSARRRSGCPPRSGATVRDRAPGQPRRHAAAGLRCAARAVRHDGAMPGAYWVNTVREVRDTDRLADYVRLAGPAIAAAGGTFVARGTPGAAFEEGTLERTAIIRFDSVDAAVAAYRSAGLPGGAGRPRGRRRARHPGGRGARLSRPARAVTGRAQAASSRAQPGRGPVPEPPAGGLLRRARGCPSAACSPRSCSRVACSRARATMSRRSRPGTPANGRQGGRDQQAGPGGQPGVEDLLGRGQPGRGRQERPQVLGHGLEDRQVRAQRLGQLVAAGRQVLGARAPARCGPTPGRRRRASAGRTGRSGRGRRRPARPGTRR